MTKPLYFYNGTTFELVGPTTPQSPIAYQTSAPTAPATGDIWIDSDGDVDTYNRQLTRFYFVATAGQTSVSGIDANGLTLAYVAGSEAVYVNGALQVRGVDYTATNGTSITGLSALALNDVVEVFAYTAFTVANAYTKSETDSIAAAAAGLRMVVPTSVTVGSGSGSVSSNGAVNFSGATSVSLNGAFSSTYTNYKIVYNFSSFSGSASNFNLRMRASGTDNSSSNYIYSTVNSNSTSPWWDGAVSTGTTQMIIHRYTRANGLNGVMDIYNPFATDYTSMNGWAVNPNFNNADGSEFSGSLTVTTSYDGFTLYPTSSQNMAGTIRVYGYKV